MEIILLGIALAFGVMTALLAIPIDAGFALERTEKLRGHVNIRWLFGLARFHIAIPPPPKQPTHKTKAKEKEAHRRKQRHAPKKIVAILKQSAFRRRIYRFITRLLRAIHTHNLRLHVCIGLDDPADTGKLWALLGPVSAMATSLRRSEVRIIPEFTSAAFQFKSQGEVRVIPLELIAIIIAFALSPPTLRAWRELRHGA